MFALHMLHELPKYFFVRHFWVIYIEGGPSGIYKVCDDFFFDQTVQCFKLGNAFSSLETGRQFVRIHHEFA